jgi:predicted XRE-type DNA-binding protein
MTEERFETAFDAVASSPEEAAHMMARSNLMDALQAHIKKQGWTQAEAAAHLGVTQPRISDLFRDKLSRFSLDHLVTMLARAGIGIDIKIKRPVAKRKEAA